MINTGEDDSARIQRAYLLLIPVFGISASIAAILDGPWLDEFWSLYLSDPTLPLQSLSKDRWFYDTHPLLSNALYRLIRLTGVDDLSLARVLLNLPPLCLFTGATILFMKHARQDRSFYPVFGILIVGFWDAIDYFADFRSYFWQMAMIATALQYVHFSLAPGSSDVGKRRLALHLVGLTAIVFSICLHFVTGLLMSVVMALTLIALTKSGRQDAIWRIGPIVLFSWALMLIGAALQLPRLAVALDVRWITTSTAAALWLYALGFTKVILTNPIAIFWAARGSVSVYTGSRDRWTFPLILLATIALGGLALLALNAVSPIITNRYLIAFQVMALAIVATLSCQSFAQKRLAVMLLLLWAIGTMGYQSFRTARQPGWRDGVDRVAAIVRSCRQTRVLAASGWRFRPDRGFKTATNEARVSGLAQERLARRAGFPIQTLDPVAPITIRPDDRCPTLIWVAHLDAYFPTPQAVLAAGDIRVIGPAELSFSKTHWGALVLIRHGYRSPAAEE